MEQKNFIKTSDKDTAEYLRKAGFVELAQEDDKWVFINEIDKVNFDSNKGLKMNFSNILCV